jgi:hypothetical protein
MHDRAMSDRDVVSQDTGRPSINMNDRSVLDVCASADLHRRDITANHSAKPNTRVLADLDIANNDASRSKENTPMNPWC